MRFIATVLMIRSALEDPPQNSRFSRIGELHEDPDKIKPSFFTQDSYDYLRRCFNIYCDLEKNKKDIFPDFPLWNHDPKKSGLYEYEEGEYTKSITSNTSNSSTTYTQRVLFFAQTQYLLRTSRFDREKFLEWMRVVRNIVSRVDFDIYRARRGRIRSPEEFDGAIKLVNELAEGCEDIYIFLSSPNLSKKLKSKFSEKQIKEEREKAKLITNKALLKDLIWEIEDNELLRGRIDFVFHCIGYKYDANAEINKSKLSKVQEFKLSKVQEVFDKHFNKKSEITDEESEITDDLRRAFLTIEVDGKYSFYDYWKRFSSIKEAPKRKLFGKYRELEYYLDCAQREYFKKLVLKLVDKLDFKLGASDDLKSIVQDFKLPNEMPNWKKRLITEPDLLANRKFIVIPDHNKYCWLLRSERPQTDTGYDIIK